MYHRALVSLTLVLCFVGLLAGCMLHPSNTEPSAFPPPEPDVSGPAEQQANATPLTILSISEGEVFIRKAGVHIATEAEVNAWQEAGIGTTLETGDAIRAGTDSRAVITFFDGDAIGSDFTFFRINANVGSADTGKVWFDRVYLSVDEETREQQLRRHKRSREQGPAGRREGLPSDSETIAILAELVRRPHTTARHIAALLSARELPITRQQVLAVIDKYDLRKKRASRRSRS